MPGQPDPRDDAKTQSPLGSAPARGRRLLVFWPGGFRELPLEDGARLTVGRATTCEVSIPDTSVSRAHAVVVGGHPCRVEDLGSANGTRVRGTQLARGGSAPLEPGTTVEIGSAMLVLQDAAVGDAVAPGVTAGAAGLDALLQRVAASTLSVLLVGETGAGKEVLALRIHRLSPRAAGPFLPLNCGALPESLLDAELFGHERGAFTGASEARAGLIESADKGTLFLDEVGEMPPSVQV
ncbi:MAG: FHA domain-containing protein, partial [Polyangiaceae bacterium]